MNCQQARRLLLLWIGQDLPDAVEAGELELHIAECNSCRSRQHELQLTLDILQSASVTATASAGQSPRQKSLWPRVAAVISTTHRFQDRFNGWLPATAVALAASLMVAVSISSVQRDLGSQPILTWQLNPHSPSSNRNLFLTDPHFATGAFHEENHSPLKPASNRLTPEW